MAQAEPIAKNHPNRCCSDCDIDSSHAPVEADSACCPPASVEHNTVKTTIEEDVDGNNDNETCCGGCDAGEKPTLTKPNSGCCSSELLEHDTLDTTSSDNIDNYNDDDDDETCCSGCDSGSLNHDGVKIVLADDVDSCGEDNEKCDEECIKTAAAFECRIACHDEQIAQSKQRAGRKQDTCCTPVADKSCCSGSKKKTNLIHKHEHDEDGNHMGQACSTHLYAAMQKYTPYLESARCICRSAIKRATRATRGFAKHGPLPSNPCFNDSITRNAQSCGRDSVTIVLHHRDKGSGKKSSVSSPVKACSSAKGCCSRSEGVIHSTAVSHSDKKTVKIEVTETDLEKTAAKPYATLHVAGMDCSGCAKNLTRALNGIPGVSDASVIFINSTAGFRFDPRISNLVDIIKHVEKITAYKLSPILLKHQALDIILDKNAAKKFRDNLPVGVESCEHVSKDKYEVMYDPCLIGARAVLLATETGELAPPRGDAILDVGRRKVMRTAVLTALAFALTIPVVVLEWGRPSGISEHTALVASIVLATFVQAIAYPEFYKPAVGSLIYNKIIEMDMLVVISITSAYVYSVVASGLYLAGLGLETKPFFETSTLLISLILLGRLLAAWARKKAVAAVSLRSLQPLTAQLVESSPNQVQNIDARLLQIGDVIQVQPHSQVVTDANVIGGTSEVDESMLTGESVPNFKTVGSSILSGTVNGAGTLTAQVSRLPGRNTITDIANLVEQAQQSKPRIQDLADKIAGYFVPVIVVIAVVTFITWIIVVLKVRHEHQAASAIGTAIGYAIAALAISCPCALGLAVPMVLVVAGGTAARRGVIIKTADVTERGHKVTDVIFDKTGTLTRGDLEVVEEVIFSVGELSSLDAASLVKSLVGNNKHPISLAVSTALQNRSCEPVSIDELASVPGCGVKGKWNSVEVRAGNPKWLDLEGDARIVDVKNRGLSLLCVTVNAELLAIFGLQSTTRDEAASVVQELHRRGINVHIVSGDNRKAVQRIAIDLGIDLENCAAERTPSRKQEYVRTLMDDDKVTLFCGDGTNDAVAVAQANVGVQIGSASDVTRATADVVLLSGLDGVVRLLDISKSAYRRIIFNFVWSVIYNLVAILLASGALVKIRIAPAYAGLGEIVSIAPVIVAAMTMAFSKPSAY